jgi:hypothetical protein
LRTISSRVISLGGSQVVFAGIGIPSIFTYRSIT